MSQSLRGSPALRLRVALIAITMVLSVFAVRLVQLQGLDEQELAKRAADTGTVKLTLPAKRGEITDRNGTPLAVSVEGMMIVADPSMTAPDAEEIAGLLADRLGLDYFTTLERLRKPDSRFQYIARRVPSTTASEVMSAVQEKGWLGLSTQSDPVRDYPAKDVAANLIGFLKDGGEPAAGLEQVFDTSLAGRDGSETFQVGGGNRIPLGENTRVDPRNGDRLELTIDRDAQWYAQKMLRNTVHQVNAQSATLVAMDTRTGELLAFADYPTFDANRGSKAPESDWGSRGLSNVYEPGSVQKVLTAAALIEEGKVNARTRIAVPRKLPVLDRVIGDYFEHGRLKLTLAGVIAKSSNIGTVLAARQISSVILDRYLRRFGLGSRSGIGLPGETRGILPPGDTWSQLTKATISFGQGLSVNAMQMTAAVNTIANGGEYISPSLVKGHATTAGGVELGTDTAQRRRVVSAATAREVSQMMEMVTTEGAGTAARAGIKGYRVAGKTGTAQQVGKKCKCYDGSLAVSFAGFAPADKPRFTVYAVVQKPARGASGGGTAGPLVRDMLNYLLQKYAVAPTGTRPAALPVEW